MRKTHPRLELHLKSRKIIADGPEAIDVIRWPVRLLIVAIAIGVLASSIVFAGAVGFVKAWLGTGAL